MRNLSAQVYAALYRDVLVKWPSPTPSLKHRCPDFVDQMPRHAIVVEIGVQRGEFAQDILRRTHPEKLYLVDCWEFQDPQIYNDVANVAKRSQEQSYRATCRRFKKDARVTILRKYSKDAAALFQDASIDWVYSMPIIAIRQSKKISPSGGLKLKRGGFLSGHDYTIESNFGVVPAVNEFIRDNQIYFHCLTTEDYFDSWAIQKPINGI
jgi:hypothetical protein